MFFSQLWRTSFFKYGQNKVLIIFLKLAVFSQVGFMLIVDVLLKKFASNRFGFPV